MKLRVFPRLKIISTQFSRLLFNGKLFIILNKKNNTLENYGE